MDIHDPCPNRLDLVNCISLVTKNLTFNSMRNYLREVQDVQALQSYGKDAARRQSRFPFSAESKEGSKTEP